MTEQPPDKLRQAMDRLLAETERLIEQGRHLPPPRSAAEATTRAEVLASLETLYAAIDRVMNGDRVKH